MLAEFKRDSARKELEQVLDAIERGRQELEVMETAAEEEEEEEEEDTDGDKIQLNKQQVRQEVSFQVVFFWGGGHDKLIPWGAGNYLREQLLF